VGVTWVRAGDAARATDGASTTDTLGAGVAGVEFRARPNRSKESEAGLRIAIYVIVAIVVLFLGSFMLLESRRAVEVKPGMLQFASGPALETTFTVWITGAAAPLWLARGQLAIDARGFLTVDGSLRSVSHPWVLGAGDVASLASRPVPKDGVYAVRQGPVLAENLMRLLRDKRPIEYKPQRRFLSLLSLGERRAVASWSNWAAAGAWVWKLKDHIDRAFMRRYEFVESTRQG